MVVVDRPMDNIDKTTTIKLIDIISLSSLGLNLINYDKKNTELGVKKIEALEVPLVTKKGRIAFSKLSFQVLH